ncbi:unnamed protein product [Notodromas monacha]|uniref:Transcriptional coactivator p15 (PC4) C-terminal domain-containing protein n=1 Tax=Notodromas monacha TaxID=399045 RepID=A0A7R9G959_9CRUS|nr:unnamed protein product [Notodromas monacha]CAG0913911.1 unnamed protein product [Notodromas monacha]
MPKPSSKRKSKQQSDSDSDSGPDDRNVKKSKNEGSSVDRDDEGNPRWMLENKRFITVRPFKGKVYIDIREFYEANGELKPGKKGKLNPRVQ